MQNQLHARGTVATAGRPRPCVSEMRPRQSSRSRTVTPRSAYCFSPLVILSPGREPLTAKFLPGPGYIQRREQSGIITVDVLGLRSPRRLAPAPRPRESSRARRLSLPVRRRRDPRPLTAIHQSPSERDRRTRPKPQSQFHCSIEEGPSRRASSDAFTLPLPAGCAASWWPRPSPDACGWWTRRRRMSRAAFRSSPDFLQRP